MGSAFAYFTDVETTTGNTFTAGTMDMQIGDNNEAYTNSPVSASFVSPANLIPGQEFTTDPVFLKNVGTSTIKWIFARIAVTSESDGVVTDAEGPSSPNDISNYLKMVKYSESTDNGASWQDEVFDTTNANDYLNFWIGRGAPVVADGVITLHDLWVVRNFGSGDYVTSLLLLDGGNAPGPLAPGMVYQVKFTFQLVPETTNFYQGDSATFSISFIASDKNEYPDTTLSDYITEPLVP